MIKKLIKIHITIFITYVICQPVWLSAQELPPRPVEVHLVQNLEFGTVILGDGSVIIPNDGGARSTTGTVVEKGGVWNAALLTVEANPGTVIRLDINNGQQMTLTNPEGGTFTCDLSNARVNNIDVAHNQTFTMPVNTFSIDVRIGGELHVTTSQPAGTCTGTFNISVIYE